MYDFYKVMPAGGRHRRLFGACFSQNAHKGTHFLRIGKKEIGKLKTKKKEIEKFCAGCLSGRLAVFSHVCHSLKSRAVAVVSARACCGVSGKGRISVTCAPGITDSSSLLGVGASTSLRYSPYV